MKNPSSLSEPKKLNLSDFPAEKKRRKESGWKKFRRRQKQKAKFNQEERLKRKQEREKRKRKIPGFFTRLRMDFKIRRAENKELRLEKARLRKRQPKLFDRLKIEFREYRQEQQWKHKQSVKRKSKRSAWAAILLFFIGPVLDFRDEIRAERKERNMRKGRFPQPNFFQRLLLEYHETRDTEKQRKRLDRVVRKALSFVVEEDKRVFSLREELEHMRDTWKSLPWKWSRDLQNMLVMMFAFVLSFSLLFGIFQLAKFGVAAAFSIPGVWRNGQIIFTIPDPSPLWTYSSVLSVYSVGPFVLAIIGFVFQRLQKNVDDKSSTRSLFYMWIYVNAYIFVFGTFLAGYFTDRGFGYVMGWLYVPWIVEVPLALFSVVMLWVIGYKAGRKFLSFRYSNKFVDSVLAQLYYKLMYFYVPIILGIGILWLFGFNENNFTQSVVYVSILIMLTPTLRFIPVNYKS